MEWRGLFTLHVYESQLTVWQNTVHIYPREQAARRPPRMGFKYALIVYNPGSLHCRAVIIHISKQDISMRRMHGCRCKCTQYRHVHTCVEVWKVGVHAKFHVPIFWADGLYLVMCIRCGSWKVGLTESSKPDMTESLISLACEVMKKLVREHIWLT